MNNLGEYVNKRRREMGLSLREFGARCGMSHTHIDSIEKGYDVRSGRRVNPTSETIKKLAQGLGVSEGELLGLNDPPKSREPDATALKFALFGDSNISDEKLEEVKKFAQFIKSRDSSDA